MLQRGPWTWWIPKTLWAEGPNPREIRMIVVQPRHKCHCLRLAQVNLGCWTLEGGAISLKGKPCWKRRAWLPVSDHEPIGKGVLEKHQANTELLPEPEDSDVVTKKAQFKVSHSLIQYDFSTEVEAVQQPRLSPWFVWAGTTENLATLRQFLTFAY